MSASPERVDVVAIPSIRADGTPDQSPGFVVIDAPQAPPAPPAPTAKKPRSR